MNHQINFLDRENTSVPAFFLFLFFFFFLFLKYYNHYVITVLCLNYLNCTKCPMNLAQFFHPFVRLYATKDLRIDSSGFFSEFLHKRNLFRSRGLKKSKNVSKVFEDIDKNLVHFYVLCLLEYGSTNNLLSAKINFLGKIWFFSYGPKISRPIRIQDSLNYII